MTLSVAPSFAGGVHRPVMVDEACDALAPTDDKTFVDATFGSGGYSRALLEAALCHVWAIDRDPDAVARGAALSHAFPRRLCVMHGRFSEMVHLLAAHGIMAVDGVTFDLGVSSPQIDDPARGFSFRQDGPLDMRMERQGPTAADFVNTASERELGDVIFFHGEEPRGRRIAEAIVRARRAAPITRTLQLADVVARAAPRRGGPRARIHPATRTFQAIRIHVNGELGADGELRRGLAAAERLLAPGGRLVVVSFHSLEDREVKHFLNERSAVQPSANRFVPAAAPARAATFRLMFRGARQPTASEVQANARARSARLRAAVRTAAPSWAGVASC